MWGFLLPLVFILYMPQTVINRRCGCKGSDNGWVVNCGATAVTPGNCTVTSDCKGTCTDAKGGDSAVYKPNRRKDIEYDVEDTGYEMNEQDLTRLISRVVNEGKFWKEVKIKDKCKTFPYCSEGAVDSPLEYPGRKKKRSKRKKSSKNKYHNIGKWISENEINHLIKRVINKV
jgi:hypothetical protein